MRITSRLILGATILFIVGNGAVAQEPIPRTYDGYRLGSTDAPLLLEAFYDLMCPDSAASWPTVQEVMTHYGPDKLQFILHRFPLPHHNGV